MTQKPRAMVTIEAENSQDLADALALLKLGAGPLLTGRTTEAHEDSGAHGFLGMLEIGELPSATPFLLALLRGMLLAPPTQRNVAAIAGRIWLASHCAICGQKVEDAQHSPGGDALCSDCDLLNSQPGGIGRLAKMEQIRLDHDTIMAFLKDPQATESDRDQFYLLMMASSLAKAAREGYRDHGRGALILDQTGKGPFQAFYVDQTTARETAIGWPSSEAETMVAEYDPLAEMVVIFLKVGNIPVTYRMAQQPDNWFNPGDRSQPIQSDNPFAPGHKKAKTA